jgi:hypothetical protein
MVIEGRDYLFYRHAQHAGGIVALIATRRNLFIIPHTQALAIDVGRDTTDVPVLLSLLLADLDLSVDRLESILRANLTPDHVIALDEQTILARPRFFRRRVRIQRGTRRTVLSLGSRRNHARFDQYFAA